MRRCSARAAPGSGPQALIGELLSGQSGGLAGLVQNFESAGLGGIINSWIGQGQNQPVSPEQVRDAVGPERVQAIAERTALPADSVLQQLPQHLPGVIDKLTPHGQIPAHDA